jgi:hypothetical protein
MRNTEELDLSNVPRITNQQHNVILDLIHRGVLVTYEQASTITGRSATWIASKYSDDYLNKYKIGKLNLCAFKD